VSVVFKRLRLLTTLLMLYVTGCYNVVLSQEAPANYRLEASVDLQAPFVGQQVVYSVRFYAQRMPQDYEYLAPDFADWWRGEQIVTERAEIIEGVSYTVRTFETLIYPLQAGALTIPPVQLVIPETVFSDRADVSTGSVTVAVQPLPEGAPASFTGGVGRFNVEAETDTGTATLGQPLTLRWTVTGVGNLAQIGQPLLEIPDSLRIYADPTTTISTTRGSGERIFEWRLIPELAGTLTIPVQSFAYFDPEGSRYVTLDVPDIVIDVLPDASGGRELPETQRGANRPAALPLKPVTSFEAHLSGTVPFWAWIIPPLIVIITVWSQAVARRARISRAARRQKRALTEAKNRLQAASKAEGFNAFSQVHVTIKRYFADKTNRDPQALTYSEIHLLLVNHRIAPDAREGLALCWLEAEEALYAPVGAIELNQLVRRTAGVLTEIDQQWKTSLTEISSASMSRRWYLWLLGCLVLLTGLVHAQLENETVIDDALRLADSAYDAGDYTAAAQFFEEAIVSFGFRDPVPPELYYNLASAYFEADNLGQALVNALRAQREMPRDPDLARTLALIRALRVDVLGDETALIDNIAAVTTGLLTSNELTLITFVLWCITFGLFLFRLLRPQLRQLNAALAVIGLVALVGLMLLIGRWYVETYRPNAVVTAFTTEALSGPGDDYVPLFTLYNAAEGRILENREGYRRLLLPDGRQGWLPAEDVTVP
jgi:tetratricopeptide (TPR) repeat protein